MSKSQSQTTPDDLRPDGWKRFENAVDAAARSGPKHRAHKAEDADSTQKKTSTSKN